LGKAESDVASQLEIEAHAQSNAFSAFEAQLLAEDHPDAQFDDDRGETLVELSEEDEHRDLFHDHEESDRESDSSEEDDATEEEEEDADLASLTQPETYDRNALVIHIFHAHTPGDPRLAQEYDISMPTSDPRHACNLIKFHRPPEEPSNKRK
jgi:hypothetical protein